MAVLHAHQSPTLSQPLPATALLRLHKGGGGALVIEVLRRHVRIAKGVDRAVRGGDDSRRIIMPPAIVRTAAVNLGEDFWVRAPHLIFIMKAHKGPIQRQHLVALVKRRIAVQRTAGAGNAVQPAHFPAGPHAAALRCVMFVPARPIPIIHAHARITQTQVGGQTTQSLGRVDGVLERGPPWCGRR